MAFTLQVTVATGAGFKDRLRAALLVHCRLKHGTHDVGAVEFESAVGIALASVHGDPSAPAAPDVTAPQADVDAWRSNVRSHVEGKLRGHVADTAREMFEACLESAEPTAAMLAKRGIAKVHVQVTGHVETKPEHVGFLNAQVWPDSDGVESPTTLPAIDPNPPAPTPRLPRQGR